MGSKFYLFLRNLALVLGLTFLVFAIEPLVKFHAAADWPQSLGTITRSDLTIGQPLFMGLHRFHRVTVRFDYQVDGRVYQGNRVNYGIAANAFLFEQFARVVLQRYPVGKTVPVYYNPKNPGDEIIERIPMPGFSMLWFTLTGLFLFLAIIITTQEKKIQTAIDKPLKKSLRPGKGITEEDIFKDHYPAAIYSPSPEIEKLIAPASADGPEPDAPPPLPSIRKRRIIEESGEELFKDHYPAAIYSPSPEIEKLIAPVNAGAEPGDSAPLPGIRKRRSAKEPVKETFKDHYPASVYNPPATPGRPGRFSPKKFIH